MQIMHRVWRRYYLSVAERFVFESRLEPRNCLRNGCEMSSHWLLIYVFCFCLWLFHSEKLTDVVQALENPHTGWFLITPPPPHHTNNIRKPSFFTNCIINGVRYITMCSLMPIIRGYDMLILSAMLTVGTMCVGVWVYFIFCSIPTN